MSAPRLNRRLVLERRVDAGDGAGGFLQSWEPLGTLWAEIEARAGRGTDAAGLPVSLMRYRVTCRAAPADSAARPAAGQRFRDGTRILAIRAVAERDAGARYLECWAEEERAT